MIVDPLQSTRLLVRFARNERRLRERAGLSQLDAAVLAGLHRTAISLLERHERTPRLGTIVRIFSVVESDPWELFDGLAWNLGHDERRWRPDAEGGRSTGAGRRLVVPGPAIRFGLLLTRQRLRAGLRQEDVGLRLRMHRPEISLIEHGGRHPGLDSILQLSAAVDSDPGDLLAGMHWIPGDPVAGGRYLVKAEASCV